MKRTFFCLFLLQNVLLFSQKHDSLVQENFVRLDYENDFFNATDRYYTQGILLTVSNKLFRYSPFSYALPRMNKRAVNYYALQFQQDCFTPKSIRHEGVFYGERPYAATMFLSHSLSSFDDEKKMLLRTQLDMGVIGPCAKCEEEQKAIHTWLKNIQPLGWEYQIKNDVIVNYRLKFEKGFISKKHFELMANGQARLGTLYTDVNAGFHIRFGKMDAYFSGLGLQKKNKGDKIRFFVYAKANVKAVAYNAALQGGVFTRDNIYTLNTSEISRCVFLGEAGAVLLLNRFGVEFSKSYLSREFKRGVDHGWGKCSFFGAF